MKKIAFTPFDAAAAAKVRHFETYNRTQAAQRVADIVAALGADPGAAIVATGDAALAALLASAVVTPRLAVLDVGAFDTSKDADLRGQALRAGTAARRRSRNGGGEVAGDARGDSRRRRELRARRASAWRGRGCRRRRSSRACGGLALIVRGCATTRRAQRAAIGRPAGESGLASRVPPYAEARRGTFAAHHRQGCSAGQAPAIAAAATAKLTGIVTNVSVHARKLPGPFGGRRGRSCARFPPPPVSGGLREVSAVVWRRRPPLPPRRWRWPSSAGGRCGVRGCRLAVLVAGRGGSGGLRPCRASGAMRSPTPWRPAWTRTPALRGRAAQRQLVCRP